MFAHSPVTSGALINRFRDCRRYRRRDTMPTGKVGCMERAKDFLMPTIQIIDRY
jgi:hypothetical protein